MQAKSNRYSRQPSKNEDLRDSSRPLTISLDFLLLFEALFLHGRMPNACSDLRVVRVGTPQKTCTGYPKRASSSPQPGVTAS